MNVQERLGSHGTQAVWVVPPEPANEIIQLARQVDLPVPLVQVLYQRGLQTPQAIDQFLHPDRYPLHDPYMFKGMSEAVERLAAALAQHERILVYGDYDVDGQVSTALLVDALRRLGGHVHYYIPRRLEEGYGLSAAALERLAPNTDLIVTVDCGITAVEEVAFAHSLGIDVIVTDHHEPGTELPLASAIIDPKQPGCSYPEKGLAGCAVVFKLVQALYQYLGKNASEISTWMDLVAVGTIADVVPLQGENRVFVWQGLPLVRQRLGLDKLLTAAGIESDEPSAGQIAFLVAPRLNAAGRLSDATPGVELLLTTDAAEAERIAHELEAENQERRQIEHRILEEADAWVHTHANLATDRALVVAGEGWHPGVIGIVASRLVERYHRPTIVLAVDGEQAVGSGRSIPGFDLHGALQSQESLLVRFGGHRAAAGLTIATEQIDAFRQAFQNEAAHWLGPDDLVPSLRIDAMLTPDVVDMPLVETIARFGPFGHGNPEPVFGFECLQVAESRGVGEGEKHWRLRVQDPANHRHELTGIGFGLGPNYLPHVQVGDSIHLAATLGINTWQGQSNVQLRLRDARVHARINEFQELEATLRRVCTHEPVGVSVIPNTPATFGALALQEEAVAAVEHTSWVDPLGRAIEFAAVDLRDYELDPRQYAIESGASEGRTLLVWADGGGNGEVQSRLSGRLEVRTNQAGSRAFLCMDHVPRTAPNKPDAIERVALVFWDVPGSVDQFRQCVLHASSWSRQLEVYFTFTPERLAEAEKRLLAHFPPIEVLRQIFGEVRKRCLNGHRTIDLGTVSQQLAAQDCHVSIPGVRYALEVFAQADLLTVEYGGIHPQVTLRQPPRGKVDLSIGVRYNEGEAKRAQLSHFATWVRSMSVANLIAQALQSNGSVGHP